MAAFKLFFSRVSPFCYYKSVQWQKVDVRGYARLFHRNPIKVLTPEEGEKLNKPTLHYEEPLTHARKTVQSPQQKFPEQTNRRFNNANSSVNLSRNVTIEENILQGKKTQDKSQSSFFDSNKNTLSRKGAKFLIKSGSYEKSHFMVDGQKLEIVTDKIIAERKLRFCINLYHHFFNHTIFNITTIFSVLSCKMSSQAKQGRHLGKSYWKGNA